MPKKITERLINLSLLVITFLIAIFIGSISIAAKVNRYKQDNTHIITSTVYKEEIPITSVSKGIINSINVRVGDIVEKDQIIMELDNPLLKEKIKALEQSPDNVSAKTEADVAKAELLGLTIKTPVAGVVGKINVIPGSSVQELTVVALVYSEADTLLLSQLSPSEYQILKDRNVVKAYNQRLKQMYNVVPLKVDPKVKEPKQGELKKIGLYFKLSDSKDSLSLLQNEDLEVIMETGEEVTKKPAELFSDFWSSLLGYK